MGMVGHHQNNNYMKKTKPHPRVGKLQLLQYDFFTAQLTSHTQIGSVSSSKGERITDHTHT